METRDQSVSKLTAAPAPDLAGVKPNDRKGWEAEVWAVIFRQPLRVCLENQG